MPIRLATRALILVENRLLIVNAFPGAQSDLWCAPGGGADAHSSLPDNLAREIWEECGVAVTVGPPALINEYHSPEKRFHQVEIFFRCTLNGPLPEDWRDTEGVVHTRRLVTRAELATLRHKPDSLAEVAWGTQSAPYDPLEPLSTP
jgi:8-oxo-dGTP diphosphatase